MDTATATHLRHDDGSLCHDQLCGHANVRHHDVVHVEMLYVGETLQARIGQHPGLVLHRIGNETFDPPARPVEWSRNLATGDWRIVVKVLGLPAERADGYVLPAHRHGDVVHVGGPRDASPDSLGHRHDIRREWVVGGGFGVHVSWPVGS